MPPMVLPYSTNLLESLFASLKTFLVKVMVGWQLARQMSANDRIAHMIKHEYPHMSVPQITDELNRKTLKFYEVKNENS